MDKARRKEIARVWTERKRVQGVYTVRCSASDQVWVSTSRNLDTQKNGVWFALRMGGHPNKVAQAAWAAHGEEAFAYEIVEEISDEGLSAIGLGDLLKARERYWREALGAAGLHG